MRDNERQVEQLTTALAALQADKARLETRARLLEQVVSLNLQHEARLHTNKEIMVREQYMLLEDLVSFIAMLQLQQMPQQAQQGQLQQQAQQQQQQQQMQHMPQLAHQQQQQQQQEQLLNLATPGGAGAGFEAGGTAHHLFTANGLLETNMTGTTVGAVPGVMSSGAADGGGVPQAFGLGGEGFNLGSCGSTTGAPATTLSGSLMSFVGEQQQQHQPPQQQQQWLQGGASAATAAVRPAGGGGEAVLGGVCSGGGGSGAVPAHEVGGCRLSTMTEDIFPVRVWLGRAHWVGHPGGKGGAGHLEGGGRGVIQHRGRGRGGP